MRRSKEEKHSLVTLGKVAEAAEANSETLAPKEQTGNTSEPYPTKRALTDTLTRVQQILCDPEAIRDRTRTIHRRYEGCLRPIMPSQYTQHTLHLSTHLIRLLLLEEDPKSIEGMNICCRSPDGSRQRDKGRSGGRAQRVLSCEPTYLNSQNGAGIFLRNLAFSLSKYYSITTHTTTILIISTKNNIIYCHKLRLVFPVHRANILTWSVIQTSLVSRTNVYNIWRTCEHFTNYEINYFLNIC